MTDDELRRYRNHFEVLADALAAPGSREPDPEPLMPMHAPEWLWRAMEAYLEKAEALEIVWSEMERTFIGIRALPDTAPGACPASEEFVWTEEEIGKDRDFEGGSAVLDDIYEEDESE